MTFTASVLTGPQIDLPEGGLIDVLVRSRAARCPDAPALVWSGGTTSYAELLAGANRVAAALSEHEVGAGDVVAVRSAPSAEFVMALLGVLLTGAAYAAVPTEWPQQRYEQLIATAGVRVCLDDLANTPVTCLPLAPEPTESSAVRQLSHRDGSDACCVFLTSGSTGAPKAILAPHAGVTRIVVDPVCSLGRPLHTAQLASLGWDAFALEVWGPLITGGSVYLPATRHTSGAGIREAIASGVNAIFLTAALFEALVEDDPDALTGLDLLLTGGERGSASALAACRALHPDIRLVHVYGPAESCIFTVVCDMSEPGALDEIAIGRPVANTGVVLLGADGLPVGPGDVGEIVITGDGLAAGYVGDPAETARRFRVVDLDGGPTRCYFSGDLARTDDANRLVFVGRKDRMIKLRGVRIEPDEIEQVIEQLPGVGRAVVLALPLDANRKDRLAAFHDGPAPADVVKKHVAAALPAAFVPDVVHPVDAFPLNTNGKVDQRALAALLPDLARERRTGATADTLATVLGVAEDLLGYPVEPDDDLFERGATSMTAIRLATRLGRITGRPLTSADVLTARSATALAEEIDGRSRGTVPAMSPTATEDVVTPPASLQRFWTAAEAVPDLHEALVPMLFRLSGEVDLPALRAALDAVVARHEVLRSVFWRTEDGLRARILPPEMVTGLLTEDTAGPLDAERGIAEANRWLLAPFSLIGTIPIRARLISIDDGDLLFAVVVQHIAFDAWSVGIFWQEFELAYHAAAAGADPRECFGTPAPGFFGAVDLQSADQAQRVPQALRYWSDLVADAPWLRFPGRTPYLPLVGPAEEVDLPLTEDLMRAAGTAAAKVGGTATAVLFAAYLRKVREFTGHPDLAVSSPVSGRFLPVSERAIGCFASMIPMRVPAAAVEPEELVAAAADQLRKAMDSPLLSLDAIYPSPPEGAPRHPLIQIYLLLEETAPDSLDLGPVLAEQIRVAPTTWMAELSLELRPHPGLGGMLRYRTDAMSRADARRFVDDWIADVWHISEVLNAARS